MARKKKDRTAASAEEMDEIRIHGQIRVSRVDDRTVELRFRVSGSAEVDGVEYIYDEVVLVSAARCMLPDG